MAEELEKRVGDVESTIRNAKAWVAGLALGFAAIAGATLYGAISAAKAAAEKEAERKAEEVVKEKLLGTTIEQANKARDEAVEFRKQSESAAKEAASRRDEAFQAAAQLDGQRVLVGDELTCYDPTSGEWTDNPKYNAREFRRTVAFNPPFAEGTKPTVVIALNHIQLRNHSQPFNVEAYVDKDKTTHQDFTAVFLTSSPDAVLRFHAHWVAVGRKPDAAK